VAGIHANHLAHQVNEKEIQMKDICGQKCEESSLPLSPLGLLEKMLQDTLPVDSMKSSMIWKKKITKHGHSYFQLQRSVPRTKGKECLSWQTFAPGTHGRGWSPLRKMCIEMAKGNKPTCQVLTVDQVFVKEMKKTGWTFDEIKDRGGKLNPKWIEWFMGFPPNHTDLSS
jgi:hypothetical protein